MPWFGGSTWRLLGQLPDLIEYGFPIDFDRDCLFSTSAVSYYHLSYPSVDHIVDMADLFYVLISTRGTIL